jgi:hypothetical protein
MAAYLPLIADDPGVDFLMTADVLAEPGVVRVSRLIGDRAQGRQRAAESASPGSDTIGLDHGGDRTRRRIESPWQPRDAPGTRGAAAACRSSAAETRRVGFEIAREVGSFGAEPD